MSKATAVLVGAGSRGRFTFGKYALENPEKLKIIAIAEPDPIKRNNFAEEHGIPESLRFEHWKGLFELGKIANGAIIATRDDLHVEPSLKAMESGYDILLEKPIDRTLEGSVRIANASRKFDKRVMVCHVLRYTDFFQTLKKLITSGIIGELTGIEHKESINYFHMAHSYVRGNWNRSDITAPIILTKSCHDLDLIYWLTGKKALKVSSFGKLSHFKKSNMPQDASLRCTDGCKVEKDCVYSAIKNYLSDNIDWPVNTISGDMSYEGRLKALKEGPYGRCVYACDNDVVDHQIVSMELESGITCTFTLQAFTHDKTRSLRIFGTRGEIKGKLDIGDIELCVFGEEPKKVPVISSSNFGHNGGDYHLLNEFVDLLSDPGYIKPLTSIEDSLESHFMAFAAEQSRKTDSVIIMNEFKTRVNKSI